MSQPCNSMKNARMMYEQMFPYRQDNYNMPGNMPMYPLPVISSSGFPTGMPASGSPTPPVFPPQSALQGAQAQQGQLPAQAPVASPAATTLQNPQFTAGFLRTQIGKKVRIDFLIGTNNLTDRSGTLMSVGVSYVLLLEEETNVVIMCDLFSIKFVSILPQGASTLNPGARQEESK